MTASIRLLGVIALSVSITGCATSDLQPSDLAYFQPDIAPAWFIQHVSQYCTYRLVRDEAHCSEL